MEPRIRRRLALLIDRLSGDYEELLRDAFVREARARSVDLIVAVGGCLRAPGGDSMNSIYRLVRGSSCDGAVVVSSRLGIHVGADGMTEFCRGLPLLALSSVGVALPDVPSVVVDNRAGMQKVVEHLLGTHGARQIAFIAGPTGSAEAADRLAGYRAALEAYGLPFRPHLVETGAFTVRSGLAAMQALFARSARFDAVVAANDGMAFGAMDALRAHGLSVPRDVMIAGFDDASASRFTNPALTTVGQPFNEIASLAIARVLAQLDGRPADALTVLDVRPAIRRSCGCDAVTTGGARSTDATELGVSSGRSIRPGEMLRDAVRAPMEGLNVATLDVSATWCTRLLDAAPGLEEPDGAAFLRELEAVLAEADAYDDALERLQAVISAFRRHAPRAEDVEDAARLEDVWHRARLLVSRSAVRAQGRRRVQAETTASVLRRVGGRLSTALSLPGLKSVLVDELPELGIDSASVCLWTAEPQGGGERMLERLVSIEHGQGASIEGKKPFPSEWMVPPETFTGGGQKTVVVMPLTFEADQLGVLTLALDHDAAPYEMLRDQVSSSIKATFLHERMVRQTMLRERLEREHIEEQSKLAQRIQTALLPEGERIAGLDVSGAMLPAVNVGGDYYDVLPSRHGGWIGIGDVTGHGLASGLIMLMVQSAIASLVANDPVASPAAVLVAVNRMMVANIRRRMKREDHMTIVLLRIETDGTVTYAGQHEDLLIYRAQTRTCERIATRGVWLGVRTDVSSRLVDRSFTLAVGDVLLLHTDGVTEARDAHGNEFTEDRVVEILATAADEPVEGLKDRVLSAVSRWTTQVADDITLVVARYVGPPKADG